MTGTYPIQFACPAMAIHVINGRLRRTDAEPMTFILSLPNGLTTIKPVTIPPTDVNAVRWPLHWMVAACAAETTDQFGNYVRVELPREPVEVHPILGYSVAKAIQATVYVRLASGIVGNGSVVFPDCKTPLYTGIAEPVIAKGSVTFP